MDTEKLENEISAEAADTGAENVESSEAVTFEDLGLDEYTLRAVAKKGFVSPSPIQILAIPRLLTGDTNLIARARTGTGKTAAFGLPIIQAIREKSKDVQALVLEPTRELAMQTCTEMQSFATDGLPRTTVLYGGASYAAQIKDLKRGSEIVVGTPGRIKDHLERKTLDISKIKYFILDEGDEMLDMGFIDDIEEIFRHANPDCRILLFSATMPAPILKIAGEFMGEYDIIEEENVIDEALLIDQSYWCVKESDKLEALVRIIDISPDFYGIVFTMTKNDADRVTRDLDLRGYEAAALHGDIMQNQREKVIERFRLKKTRILVATDVAARGIDISGLTHVINYSLPFDTATYVHRIGRTGRAGTTGTAITFVRPEERRKLGFLSRNILKATKSELKEGKIPSVNEVLSVKEKRVVEELKSKLFVTENIIDEDDNLQEEEAVPTVETIESALSVAENTDLDLQKEDGGSITNTENSSGDSGNSSGDSGNKSVEAENGSGTVEGGSVDSEVVSVDSKNGSVDSENQETSCNNETPKETSKKTIEKVSVNKELLTPMYTSLAHKLCEDKDAEEVLAGVLAVLYGEKLSPKHYGRISTRDFGPKTDQLRVFVSLGKKDGYRAKEIADYFSKLLHIPGRMVDDIDVAQQFSLVSLPKASAKKAIEMSKSNNRMPHMHLDSKEDGGSRRQRRSESSGRRQDDFGRGRRGGQGDRDDRGNRGDRGGHGFSGRGRGDGRDCRDGRDGRDGRGGRSKGSRPNVHVQSDRKSSKKSGGASMYKKSSKKAERF